MTNNIEEDLPGQMMNMRGKTHLKKARWAYPGNHDC
jgi:hypothetical protein